MRYSSRKLSNGKVITTACNFWRQIACSFKVMSRNILILGKKIFEIPPFSQTRPGDLGKKVHACSLCFSALKVPMRSLLSAKNRERVGERTAFSASIPVTSQLMVESRNDRAENAWGLGYSGLFTQPRWAISFTIIKITIKTKLRRHGKKLINWFINKNGAVTSSSAQ